jgi:osmotically-inducible protein OsmY
MATLGAPLHLGAKNARIPSRVRVRRGQSRSRAGGHAGKLGVRAARRGFSAGARAAVTGATIGARVAAAAPKAASVLSSAQQAVRPSTHDTRRSRGAALGGAAVGVTAMYLLDPEQGRRRRHIVRDKALKYLRRGLHEGSKKGQYARGVVKGMAYEASGPMGPLPGELDDTTLAHKVESEAFRDELVPKGQLNVNCEDAVVYLRGELPTSEQIDLVLERVGNVAGVRQVMNLMHTPGSPPPSREASPSR